VQLSVNEDCEDGLKLLFLQWNITEEHHPKASAIGDIATAIVDITTAMDAARVAALRH
jgi:hypothetical protein